MSKDWSDTASIKKSELINAPAEKVFAIAEDISNLPKYFAEFSSAARSGDSYQCAYDLRIVGIPLIELRATLSARDVKKPTALTYVIDGMAKGTVRWTLQEQGGGTLVSVDISYQMSTKVFQDTLGILLERNSLKHDGEFN